MGKYNQKKVTSSSLWLQSTVSNSDLAARYSKGSSSLNSVLARAASAWVYNCAALNAQYLGSFPLYLCKRSDTKAPDGTSKRHIKKVSGRRKAAFQNPSVVGKDIAMFAEEAGDFETIYSHPLLDYLKGRNSDNMTGSQLDRLGFLTRELVGNSFELVVTDKSGMPIERYPMYVPLTTIVPADNGENLIAGYMYGKDTQEFIEAEDVQHLRFEYSLTDPFLGVGPLHRVLAQADLLKAADLFELALWENSGRPDYIIKVADGTVETEIDRIRAEFKKDFKGPGKAGRNYIARNVDVVPLGFSPKDMQYLQGRKEVQQCIFSAYGIPESLMKLSEAQYNNALTGNVNYLRQTIQPRLCHYAEDLTYDLLPRFGLEPGEYWLSYDNVVPEDKQFIMTQTATNVGSGVWTIDEARQAQGEDPTEDGSGSVRRINGVPILAPEKPTDASPTAPAPTPLDPSQSATMLGIGDKLAAETMPPAAARIALALALPMLPPDQIAAFVAAYEKPAPSATAAPGEPPAATPQEAAAPAAEPTAAPKAAAKAVCSHPLSIKKALWDYWDGRTPEGKASDPVLPFEKEAIDALKAKLEPLYKEVASTLTVDSEGNVDIGDFQKKLMDKVGPELEKIFKHGGTEGLKLVENLPGGKEKIESIGVGFDIIPEKALEFFNRYQIKLAQEVEDNYKESIRAEVLRGIESEEPLSTVTANLKEALGIDATYRAERIARTETNRAYSQGQLSAYREVGAKKKFLKAPDPCPICDAVAEKFSAAMDVDKPLFEKGSSITGTDGKDYAFDFEEVSATPIHPQCRCSIVPEFE